jgi:hypothetical protein
MAIVEGWRRWDGLTYLELDLLGGAAGSVDEHGLAESDNALLDTRDGTLEHKEVVVDLSVTDEATHGGDGLLGDIELGRGVTSIVTAANTVDLVVDRGTVVVTVLTGTGNGPLDCVGVSIKEEIFKSNCRTYRAKGARHRYKRPYGDPCGSFSGASWCPNGR